MSQAGSLTAGGGGGGGASINTITGNVGGAQTPDGANNFNIITANATPKFVGTAATETLDFGLNNLALGSSLPLLTTGTTNVSLGLSALSSITSGTANTAVGHLAMQNSSATGQNIAVGTQALNGVFTSPNNVALGYVSMSNFSGTGQGCNTAVGAISLNGLTFTGAFNIAIGFDSSGNYSGTESSNICISSFGVIGDNNTIRIGTQGSGTSQQNSCYIAGISGVTPPGPLSTVTINSSGQLGVGSGTGSAFTWTDKNASFAAAASNGYFVTATATASLPAAPVQGDEIIIVNDVSGQNTTIQANAGQFIMLGNATTLVAGSIVSQQQGDSITLVYRAAVTKWETIAAVGNWQIV